MSHSATVPEYKYDAFGWLPLEQWDAKRLLTDINTRTGKHNCKLCDLWVTPGKIVAHAKEHLKVEKKRREAKRLAALEAAREAREEQVRIRREEKGVNVSEDRETPVNPEGFTIIQYAEKNGLDVPSARKEILSKVQSGEFVVAGKAQTGTRGRPPVLYAKKS